MKSTMKGMLASTAVIALFAAFAIGSGMWQYAFTYGFWEFMGHVAIADLILMDIAALVYLTYRHYMPHQ